MAANVPQRPTEPERVNNLRFPRRLNNNTYEPLLLQQTFCWANTNNTKLAKAISNINTFTRHSKHTRSSPYEARSSRSDQTVRSNNNFIKSEQWFRIKSLRHLLICVSLPRQSQLHRRLHRASSSVDAPSVLYFQLQLQPAYVLGSASHGSSTLWYCFNSLQVSKPVLF